MANGGNIKFGIDFQTNKAGLNEVSNGLQNIMTQIQAITKSNNMDEEFKKAAEEAKKLESIISSSWNDKLGQLNLDKFSQSIKDAYGNAEGLRTSLEKVGPAGQTAFNAIASQVLNTNIQLKEGKTLLDEMAETMANTVKWGISSSIFNNITSAIQQSFYYAKDLDRELNNIRIVTGDSADQMERFAKVANQTAKDLGRSTLDYTKAATSFYQQGLGDEQVAARTKLTLMAQNITGAGSQMVDYLTSVWNGFQVGMEDAEKYVDKLAKVADSSASDMNELAKAMSKVSATANLVGVDADQLNAMLATVIATTRQAPEAVGTAFKTILTRINDIKTGADDAEISLGNYSSKMASLGFNVLDANGRLRDTGQVLEQIGSRWETLSKQQQVYLAQTMGGQRQITQISALFQNWGMYTDLLNDSLNSEGTLLQKNNIYLESTAAHMEKLGTEKERTADILFDAETVNTFVDALTGALDIFNDFIEGIGGGINTFTYFGSVVAGVFNKQIAQSILNAENSLKNFISNKNLDKIKQDYATQITTNSGVDYFQTEKTTVQQDAIIAKAREQANIYAETLKARQGLTAEQQKELTLMQQEYGHLKQQEYLLEHIQDIRSQYGMQDLTDIESIKQRLNILKEQNSEQSKILSVISQVQNAHSKEVILDEEQTQLRKNLNILYEKGLIDLNQYDAILEQQQGSETIIEALLKQQKIVYEGINGELKQITTLKQLQEAVDRGDLELIKQQSQAIKNNETNLKNAGQHVVNIQRGIQIASAAGQALTTIGGALASGLAEGATASEKLNATWSGINGTIGACLTLIPGFGPALNMVWGGVTSIGKAILEATGLWEEFEYGFKSTEQKIADLKNKIQEVNEVNRSQTSKISELESIVSEYEKLSEKAGAYGVNIENLTEEEKNRYHELNNKFSEYNSAVIAGYDEQGNAIVRGQEALLDTIEILKQAKKQATTTAIGNLDQYLGNIDAGHSVQSIQEQKTEAQNRKQEAERQLSQGGGDITSAITYLQHNFLDAFDAEIANLNDSDLANEINEKVGEYRASFANLISEAAHAATPQAQVEKIQDAAEIAFKMIDEFQNSSQKGLTKFDEYLSVFSEDKKRTLNKVIDDENALITELQQRLKPENQHYSTEDSYAILYIMQNYLGEDQQWESLLEQANKIGLSIEDVTKILSSHIQTFENSLSGREALDKARAYAELLANGIQQTYNIINTTIKNSGLDNFEGTAQEKQNEIKKALRSIFNSQDFKQLTTQSKKAFINVVKQMFNLSDLEVNIDTGVIQSLTTQINQTLSNTIKNNIGNSNSGNLANQIMDYLLGQFDEDKLSAISTAIGENSPTFQSFEDFLDWLQRYEEQINQIAKENQTEIVIQKIDKITNAIQKIQNGKDLKWSEKQQFVAEGIISEQELEGLQTREQWLELLIGKINDIVIDQQRQEYIVTLFKDIDSLNDALNKKLIDPSDYEAVWREVFQEQLKALGMDIDALKRYADAKGIAFDKNNVDQAVWEEVLNLKKHEQQVDQLTSKYEKLKDVKIKDGTLPDDLDQLWELLQKITGQDISYTWLINNLELIGTIIENNKNSVEGLVQALTNLASGKAFQQGTNLTGLDAEQVSRSQTITTASAGFQSLQSTGIATKEQEQAIDELAKGNKNLAAAIKDGNYASKEALFYLQQELQIQQQIYDFYDNYINNSAILVSNLQKLKTGLLKETQKETQNEIDLQQKKLDTQQKQLQKEQNILKVVKDKLLARRDQLQSQLQSQRTQSENALKDLNKTNNLYGDGLVTRDVLDKNQEKYNQAVKEALQTQKQLKEVNDQIFETKNRMTYLQRSQTDIQKQKIDLNTSEQEKLKNQKEQLKNQQKILQNQQAETLGNVILLQLQSNKLKSEIESKQTAQQIAQANLDRAGVETSYNQLEEEKQQLQRQYLDVQQQITEKEKEFIDLGKQIKENQENQSNLQEQKVQDLNSQVDLKKQIARIDELIKESEQTSDQSIARLQTEEARLKKSKEELTHIQDTNVQKIKSVQIDQQIANAQERIAQIKEDQVKTISQLKKQAQQQNALIENAAAGSQEETDAKIRLAEIQGVLNQKYYERIQIEEQLRRQREYLDQDVKEDEWINLTEHLQQAAASLAGFSDQLRNNQEAAEDVAESLLRYDSALASIQENMQKWTEALENDRDNASAMSEVISELTNVYSDLFNLPFDELPESFVASADNLKLLQQAAQGSEQAYNSLRQIALEQLIINVEADLTLDDFYSEQGRLYDEYNQIINDLANVQVGATLDLDTTQALANMAQALYQMGLSTGQIENMFRLMGANVQLATGDAADFIANEGYYIADSLKTTAEQAGTHIADVADSTANEVGQAEESTSYEAEVNTEEQPADTQHQIVGYTPEITPIPLRYMGKKKVGTDEDFEWVDVPAEGFYPKVTIKPNEPTVITDHKKASSTAVAIINKPTKDGGGRVKFNNTSHGAGSAGRTARTPSTSSSRTPSSRTPSSRTPSSRTPSSRTSSTPSQKPEKIKDPQTMEYLHEQRDRYHDIDIQIKQIQADLKKVQKLQEKLNGKDLIANLNKQLQILQKQKRAYQDKLLIAQMEVDEIRNSLSQQGVTFDENGIINNYNRILQQKQNKLNNIIAHYNSLSAEQQQTYKAVVDAAKKDYQDFKKLLECYDDLTVDVMPGLEESIEDIVEQQIQIQISKFKIKVDLDIDTSKAQREFNKFKKKVIDKIRDDDIIGNINSLFGDLASYYKDGAGGVLDSLTQQINNTLYEINQIKSVGYSNIYGNNLKQAEEDLQKYTEQLMNNLEDVEDIINEIHESIFDAIDAASEAFDEQIDKLEFINDLIDHGRNLIELLYGDEAYNRMQKYYELQNQNNLKNLDFQRRAVDMWRQKMEQQKRNMQDLDPNSNAYKEAEKILKEYEKQWMDASKSLNDLLQDSIKNIIDKYSNAINKIFDQFDKKMTNGKGINSVEEEWQLMMQYSEIYLDRINAAYEMQKLQMAYKEAIDNNEGNLAAQKSLNGLMEQQLKYLKDKENLTQYDIDKANALLEIEVKRLALEQTRASKTKLRLRRDSQGNYTYQYTSDEQETRKTREELAKAENDLWNLTKKANEDSQKSFLKTWQEFEEKRKEIWTNDSLSLEQKSQKDIELRERYEKIINAQLAENQVIRQDLMEQTFSNLATMYGIDVSNFQNMSQEQQRIMVESIVPNFTGGLQQMMNAMIGEGGFGPVTEQMYGDLGDAAEQYQEDLDAVEQTAGIDFSNIDDYIQDTIDYTETLTDDNQDLITSYKNLITEVGNLINKLDTLILKYGGVTSAAIQAAGAANGLNNAPTESTHSNSDFSSTATNNNNSSTSSSSGTTYSAISGGGGELQDPGEGVGLLQYSSATLNPALTSDAVSVLTNADVERIAAAIYLDNGGYNNNPERRRKLIQRWGQETANKVQAYLDKQAQIGYADIVAKYWNQQQQYGNTLRKYYYHPNLIGLASGGYTGDWNDQTGRLAVLHEKELVLNKQDTQNLLSAINIVRSMNNLLSGINNIGTGINPFFGAAPAQNASTLRQHITIDAHFPNVTNHNEIEKAFNNLVNMASQYAYSNKI